MKCPYVIKICTKCKRILVANKMNFSGQKNGRYGVTSVCKTCSKKEVREFKAINNENIYKKCRVCKINLPCTTEYFNKNKGNKDGLTNLCKKCRKKINQTEEYKIKHREEVRKYQKNNPEKEFNRYARRRFKIANQGRGITKEQWKEMMEFFEWKCAYSGTPLNKDNRTIDHIFPLKIGGLNEPWNCVPMYANYNFSKQGKDMMVWYREQEFFSEERLNKIYEWIWYSFKEWGYYF